MLRFILSSWICGSHMRVVETQCIWSKAYTAVEQNLSSVLFLGVRWFEIDVSGPPIGSIFKDQAVEEADP